MDSSSLLSGLPKLTEQREAELKNWSRSWMMLHRVIKSLDETDLLQMLLIEMSDRKRPMIIVRLLARYRSLREQRENAELFMGPSEMARKLTSFKEYVRARRNRSRT